MVNTNGIVYTLGMSFAIIYRTRLNIMIGMGKPEVAKKAFVFFYKISSFVGFFTGILLYSMRNFLARQYAANNAIIRGYYVDLLIVYCIVCTSEVSIQTALVGMKTVGKIVHLLTLNAVVLMIGNFIGCFILEKLGYGAVGFWSMVMALVLFQNILCVYFTLSDDWNMPVRKDSHIVELLESPEFKELSDQKAV